MNGIVGFRYNNTDYYYVKNVQGDVLAIYNASGTKVASYVYDAWGRNLSVTNYTSANIGTINPFRYRSYYYDVETGLYYLQSRYYDPEVGRFINSDSVAYLGKGKELINYNLFAYCSNNPVNRVDYMGTKDDDKDGRPDDEDNDFKDDDEETCNPASGGFGGGGLGNVSTGGDGKGFKTFSQAKKHLGSPGEGNEWHHIVEKCQTKPTRSNFPPEKIHNTKNLVALDESLHELISTHYSSRHPSGGTVRDYLTNQSFEEQYRYGIEIIEKIKAILKAPKK